MAIIMLILFGSSPKELLLDVLKYQVPAKEWYHTSFRPKERVSFDFRPKYCNYRKTLRTWYSLL